ncbi:MAG: hypothetical protein HUJ93_03470 [Bacteroidales bacterium]|nr:hypothetical protein [Bacteroidales bacterium]
MKRYLLLFFLLIALPAEARIRHEVHTGFDLPIYTVLGVSFPDEIEKISPGEGIGYKWMHTSGEHFSWYLGADIYHHTMTFESKAFLSPEKSVALKGHSINIPLGAGVRYTCPVSPKTALYGDLGAGINMLLGYKRTYSEKDAISLSDGKPLTGLFVEKTSKFYNENGFSGLCNDLLGIDSGTAPTLYFTTEIGAAFNNRLTIGLVYSNFGKAEIRRTISQQVSDGNNGHSVINANSSAVTVLSSLAIRIGWMF